MGVTFILVSGSGIGAGKTTLADALADMIDSFHGALRHPSLVIRDGFARGVRHQAKTLVHPRFHHLVDSTCQKDKRKKVVKLDGASVVLRELLLSIGEGARAENVDHWCEALFARHKAEIEGDKDVYIIVDDCRMPNEVAFFRNKGFKVAHIFIDFPGAEPEPFPTEAMKSMADKIVSRNKMTDELPLFGMLGKQV